MRLLRLWPEKAAIQCQTYGQISLMRKASAACHPLRTRIARAPRLGGVFPHFRSAASFGANGGSGRSPMGAPSSNCSRSATQKRQRDSVWPLRRKRLVRSIGAGQDRTKGKADACNPDVDWVFTRARQGMQTKSLLRAVVCAATTNAMSTKDQNLPRRIGL